MIIKIYRVSTVLETLYLYMLIEVLLLAIFCRWGNKFRQPMGEIVINWYH